MKLTIQLLTWNGKKYIPHLFESLRKQTNKDWQLYIRDNGSTDNTVALIEKELQNFPFAHFFEKGQDNLGFAGGHNLIFEQTETDYIMLLNQDLYFEPDCIEKMIAFMEQEKGVAAVSPRLMKWNFNSLDDFFSPYVDSLGLKVFKNRRVVDWYNGKKYSDFVRYNKPEGNIEVFGVSGTMPMYRRSSLGQVLYYDKFIFDPNYGSYKEDVDLAFRLRSAGYKTYIILDTCAYHDRSSNITDYVSDNKRKQPEHVKYNSYRNHLMTIYKNLFWQNFILDFFYIIWYETVKFVWFLLFDRSVLRGWVDIAILRKDLKEKRKQIIKKRNIKWREMRKWIN